MYTTGHVIPVLPIKHLVISKVNQLRHTNWQLAQIFSIKPTFFFCLCVVLNSNAYVDTNALNMVH